MDRLNVPVHDDDLRTEIGLVTDLIIAANQSDGPLCALAIDAVLAV